MAPEYGSGLSPVPRKSGCKHVQTFFDRGATTGKNHMIQDWLVVVVSTPLKNMKVDWDDELPNI